MPDKEDRKTSWNDRYQSKSYNPLLPEPFLVDHIFSLKPGSVLDIACGEGRNSLFLAQMGFQVSAVDFSEVALDRLRKTSTENNLIIDIIESDLSNLDCLQKLKKYDNIIVIHFKLGEDLLERIPSLLSDDGIFLYCTFSHRQSEETAFPEEYCLKEGSLSDKKWALTLLKYSSFKDIRGYHDGYLFRR